MEEPIVETRSRSRSKTPTLNLRVSADRELNGDEKITRSKKTPTVKTIEEEVVTETVKVEPRITRQNVTKSISENTGDIVAQETTQVTVESSEVQSEKSNTSTFSSTVTRTTSTSSHSASGKREESKSSSASSKHSASSANVQATHTKDAREVSQNEINRVLEDRQTTIKTSTPKQTSKSRQVTAIVSPLTDMSQHVAYKEYKDAGEYWNKYPKTDFTYSMLSPHRREIAPGIIAMPNMSRKSLDKHHDRVNVMVSRNPNQESYIRERYASTKYTQSFNTNAYDSQDEVDLSQFETLKSFNAWTTTNTSSKTSTSTTTTTTSNVSLVRRFFMSIVTLFYASVHGVSRLFRKSDHNLYYTRIEDERGFFSRSFSYVSETILSMFKRIYLFISSVLYLDSWLLQSSAAGIEQNKNRKKKFVLGLLMLLPFLLLGAWLLAEDDQTIIFPTSTGATLTFASMKHYFPSLKLDDFSLNLNYFNNLNWNHLFPSSSQYENIKSDLKKSLSNDEYNDLMKHIDTYIENLLKEKYHRDDNRINAETTSYVANLIQENLQLYKYELSGDDLDKIAENVKLSLINSHQLNSNKPVLLSKENLDEITNIVSNHIHLNQNNFVINEHQIEDILLRILTSDKLIEVIDGRILEKLMGAKSSIEHHNALIENLQNELKEIKIHLNEKLLSKHLVLEDNLNLLQSNQERLADQFHHYRIENDEKYQKLLNEIEVKLTTMNDDKFAGINDIIKKNILEILGINVAQELSDDELKSWISSLFVAKDYLEKRLGEHMTGVNVQMEEQVKKSAILLMSEVGEKIKQEVLISVNTTRNGAVNIDATSAKGGLSEFEVRRIVRDALVVYDADKTGLVDYALESAGGQILSTRCTESYQTHSAQISIFGFPLWYPTNTPRTVISPTMQPGQCWAFQGFPGYLVIQLNTDVVISGVTMEHIPKLLAPNGQIDSAPKNFSVWGLVAENDPDAVLLGKYEYLDDSSSLQYFPVQNKDFHQTFRIVELRIESNHGNANYTCLYRFRVHGNRI